MANINNLEITFQVVFFCEGEKVLNKKRKLLAILLVIVLVLPIPSKASEIQSYQNPSYEETARKLEVIARSKNIPSVILKAVAFVETGWRQFDKNGNVVTNPYGPRPGLGIMQVTSYNSSDTELVKKLKYDIDFNIAYGADILNAKWDFAPKIGNGDRNILENWYYALWAYNGWVPYNNPNNAAAAGRVAYQDKILSVIGREYLAGVVTPVQITPISRELFPFGTLPSRSLTWETPEPYNIGDLRIGSVDDASRGDVQGTFTRRAGNDRIDTVNRIALTGWPYGTETVIITRADDFPDALAGVPLAKRYAAPILITNPGELDLGVIETLNNLKPTTAIILGGEGAISQNVETQLRETLHWTEDIQRIAGQDRFETAALIAQQFPKEGIIAIATGMDFPDALSMASAAASADMPLLLTAKDKVPDITIQAMQELQPRGIYLAGGENSISPQVVEQLSQISGIAIEGIIRLHGNSRYETSVKIAEKFYPEAGGIYLATGQDFTDPLAAGALAASKNGSLILIPPGGFAIGSSIENYLIKQPQSTDLTVVGGRNTINENTILQIKYLLRHI